MTPEIVNGCELYLGDCLEVLPTLDIQVDAIITDLPYGTTACKWDTVIPFAPMWEQVKRLLKKRGAFVTTASQPFTSALVMSNPKWFRYEWIWSKTMPTGLATAKIRPMKYHENISVFYNEQPEFNGQRKQRSDVGRERLKGNGKILMAHKTGSHFGSLTNKISGTYRQYDPQTVNPGTVLEFGSVPNCNGTKLHPTQKPVALYEYLIRTYTNPGDTVMDFCMGSGTTGVAAINTGRNFIGVEKDAGYFEIACKRIAEAQPEQMLPSLDAPVQPLAVQAELA